MAIIIFSTLFLILNCTPQDDKYSKTREVMVSEQIENRGIANQLTLDALRKVPRHKFVPTDLVDRAYNDGPLPIGYGQTISQPYIVAYMTAAINSEAGQKVLEIGTGSGYQAAVLAEIVDSVFTIEIITDLYSSSKKRIQELGYKNVLCKNADGYYGWEEHAPFDAIIVTAAPDHIPRPLLRQLKDGGRMIIPIGAPGAYQSLWKFVYEDGELAGENMGDVRFVPFTGGGQRGRGGYEWPLP